MKVIERKSKFNIISKDIWFFDKKNVENMNEDVINFFGVDDDSLKKIKKKHKNVIAKKQYTLFIDLNNDEETIYDKINKTVKYEINRCQKEEFYFEVFQSSMINKFLLNDFEIVYNNMYKDKGLKNILDKKMVIDYIKNDNFILTVAKREDDIYVYHAYTFDNNNVRLLYSCSNFRKLENKKAEIGRANKFLHWEDIKFFKSIGIKKYDFGGISSIDNPNGIDKFKMNFNGEINEYYNVVVTNGFKIQVLNFIKNILRR